MMKNINSELMNAAPLVRLDVHWNKPLMRGTLIGFSEGGFNRKITVAFPLWSIDHQKRELQLILYTSLQGTHYLDISKYDEKFIYVNINPIIVDEFIVNAPADLSVRMEKYFKGKIYNL